ncbi:hypothetical protein [Wenzhou pacific spadenose shark paramyxovirus]|uniref:Uncharacterized protein n=1 Tax=Wenzhou pacific spadenose shark paramyxovirus TaxID=2116452 RepID=A0A2P1GN15_9MONO|nr:hypothetical protein QKD25_gp05 [Wenzhou pacific spadenose shark paramyxovirus]AVM87360.1 hypothetical protein [Wenzhou pacific spadenose shark paramyxovirus]
MKRHSGLRIYDPTLLDDWFEQSNPHKPGTNQIPGMSPLKQFKRERVRRHTKREREGESTQSLSLKRKRKSKNIIPGPTHVYPCDPEVQRHLSLALTSRRVIPQVSFATISPDFGTGTYVQAVGLPSDTAKVVYSYQYARQREQDYLNLLRLNETMILMNEWVVVRFQALVSQEHRIALALPFHVAVYNPATKAPGMFAQIYSPIGLEYGEDTLMCCFKRTGSTFSVLYPLPHMLMLKLDPSWCPLLPRNVPLKQVMPIQILTVNIEAERGFIGVWPSDRNHFCDEVIKSQTLSNLFDIREFGIKEEVPIIKRLLLGQSSHTYPNGSSEPPKDQPSKDLKGGPSKKERIVCHPIDLSLSRSGSDSSESETTQAIPSSSGLQHRRDPSFSS